MVNPLGISVFFWWRGGEGYQLVKVYVRTVDGQIHADRHRGCRLILEFWLVDEGHPPKRRATQPNLFRRYALDPGRRDLPKAIAKGRLRKKVKTRCLPTSLKHAPETLRTRQCCSTCFLTCSTTMRLNPCETNKNTVLFDFFIAHPSKSQV